MSIEEWKQWLIRLLMSESIVSVMLEEKIREQASRHYDLNLDYAIKSLMDKGIITQLQSEGQRKYHINIDKIEEAKIIARREIPKEKTEFAQPYIPEPKKYYYWFDAQEKRSFRKQNRYRIFKNKNGERSFAGQLLGKSTLVPTTYYTGSLDDPASYISRLVRAMHESTKENKNGTFILQNLQDRDLIATGGNRQRGKVIILICEKLGIIEFAYMKGISAHYKFCGDTNQHNVPTLDDFSPESKVNLENFTDPEYFGDEEKTIDESAKTDKDLEGKAA